MAVSEERRRYIRLEAPIDIRYVVEGKDRVLRTVTKNISALGTRLSIPEEVGAKTSLEITMDLPNTPNPVHIKGQVVWVKRLSLKDGSSYDIGIEFTKIEEDNKNTFLKFLCDLIYKQSRK